MCEGTVSTLERKKTSKWVSRPGMQDLLFSIIRSWEAFLEKPDFSVARKMARKQSNAESTERLCQVEGWGSAKTLGRDAVVLEGPGASLVRADFAGVRWGPLCRPWLHWSGRSFQTWRGQVCFRT